VGWRSLGRLPQEPKQPLKHVGVLTSQDPCPLQPDNPIAYQLGLKEADYVEGHNVYQSNIAGRSIIMIDYLNLRLICFIGK